MSLRPPGCAEMAHAFASDMPGAELGEKRARSGIATDHRGVDLKGERLPAPVLDADISHARSGAEPQIIDRAGQARRSDSALS